MSDQAPGEMRPASTAGCVAAEACAFAMVAADWRGKVEVRSGSERGDRGLASRTQSDGCQEAQQDQCAQKRRVMVSREKGHNGLRRRSTPTESNQRTRTPGQVRGDIAGPPTYVRGGKGVLQTDGVPACLSVSWDGWLAGRPTCRTHARLCVCVCVRARMASALAPLTWPNRAVERREASGTKPSAPCPPRPPLLPLCWRSLPSGTPARISRQPARRL